MKQIVDSSYLRHGLREYLSAAKDNVAILPDQLAMELFKGTGQTDVKRSLQSLAEFPEQVLVLRSTHDVIKLRPRPDQVEREFVDAEQTMQFRAYSQALFAGELNAQDRAHKETISNVRYSRQFGTIEVIRDSIRRIEAMLTPDELKNLRAKRPMSPAFVARFADEVLAGAGMFVIQELKMPPPTFVQMLYTYPFRYVLCAYACAIDWIMQGAHQGASPERLMNDFTDMAYAAYGTFFDGVLTNDRKLHEIYAFARFMLTDWFLRALKQSRIAAPRST